MKKNAKRVFSAVIAASLTLSMGVAALLKSTQTSLLTVAAVDPVHLPNM